MTEPVRLLLGISTPRAATTRSRSPSPSISIGVTWAGAWTAATTVSVNDPRGNCRIQLTRSRRASQTSTSGRPSPSRSAICTCEIRGRSPAVARSPIGDASKDPDGRPSGSIDAGVTAALLVAGAPAAGDQPGADQQGERRRPAEAAPWASCSFRRRRNYRPEWRARGDLRRRRCRRRCRSPARCAAVTRSGASVPSTTRKVDRLR